MTSEAFAQSQVRLEAARLGYRLHRNNVGVLFDATGRPVRFGLANESKALNERLKSSDLIGWKPVTVTADMVGQVVAVFTSIECKKPGWVYRADPREQAQKTWIELVKADGGIAFFSTGKVDP